MLKLDKFNVGQWSAMAVLMFCSITVTWELKAILKQFFTIFYFNQNKKKLS